MSCAVAALVVALGAWPATAQDSDTLRGEVPEDALNTELLRRQRQDDTRRLDGTAREDSTDTRAEGIEPPTYQPESQGALPDEPEPAQAESLFSTEPEADIFSEPPREEIRAPSSAIARRNERRDRLLGTARTTAKAKDTSTDRPRASEVRADDETLDEDPTAGIEPEERVEGEQRYEEKAQRAEAIESLTREKEENPYAPLGLRLGSFNVYTTLEQGLNWTDNVNSAPKPESALQSETTLRLRAESDWAEHAATVEAFGTLRETLDGPKVDDNEIGLNASLRYDLADDFRAVGTLRYQRKPESATSPVVIEDAVTRPLRQTLEGTAGLEKDVGKLRLSIIGGIVRDDYGDAELASGAELSQKDRNSTLATVKLRTGYQISPALTPFVEVEAGRRRYEVESDAAGFQRSSDRLAARAGLEVDLGEKLRGEIAAGWLREKPDDERLAEISGPSVEGSLTWSPLRGTNVNLFGSTIVETTTTAGESGSLLHTGRLSVDRQLRANLTGTALAGAAWRDYIGSNGHDLTLTAETSLTWWLNRYLGLTGRARHERVESNLEGRDTKTNSVFLGLKLQR